MARCERDARKVGDTVQDGECKGTEKRGRGINRKIKEKNEMRNNNEKKRMEERERIG